MRQRRSGVRDAGVQARHSFPAPRITAKATARNTTRSTMPRTTSISAGAQQDERSEKEAAHEQDPS